jgi:SAM-dependent methyltransferase
MDKDDRDDIGSSGKSVALETRTRDEGGRRCSPSVARNRAAITEVMAIHMPVSGHILEIASGTGEHGAYFTDTFPDLDWTYSDLDEMSMDSQRAWARQAVSFERLHGPLEIDARRKDWGIDTAPYDGLFCANMIHIAPFSAAEGLLAGAGRILGLGGRLLIYGPFARRGVIAPSNEQFDGDLKRRDPEWGVRDLDREILPLAEAGSLELVEAIEMPANNLSVVFEKI